MPYLDTPAIYMRNIGPTTKSEENVLRAIYKHISENAKTYVEFFKQHPQYVFK